MRSIGSEVFRGGGRSRRWVWAFVVLSALTGLGDQSRGDEAASTSGVQTSPFDAPQTAEVRPPRPKKRIRSLPEKVPATQPQTSVGQSSESSGDVSEIETQQGSGVQELSVEPGSQPLLPDDAPAWVGALPDTSSAVHYVYVGGLIAETPEQAAGLLDEALVIAVESYVEETLLKRPGGANALRKQLTPDFIWKNLVDDPRGYTARLNTSGIPMYQTWVTVSITPQQRELIKRWDREAMQRQRLAPVGIGVLGGLACVGVLHLILKGRKPQQ